MNETVETRNQKEYIPHVTPTKLTCHWKNPAAKEEYTVLNFRLNLSRAQVKELRKNLTDAELAGNLKEVKRYLSILAISENQSFAEIAAILHISVESVRQWFNKYLVNGVNILTNKMKSGRPAKLTKTQRRALSEMIKLGPSAAGFPGACWRTPMIQHLIRIKFVTIQHVNHKIAI
jgi:transposase